MEQPRAQGVSLTATLDKAQTLPPAQPMWTADMEYFIFCGGPDMKPQALQLASGRVRQIVDEDATALALDRKTERLYYAVGRDIRVINVGLAHRKVAAARTAASLPARTQRLEGGMSVDCKSGFLYAASVIEQDKKWAILALNLESNRWQLVVETDFPVADVQANPAITGIIMFCNAAAGADRIWLVNAGGTNMRPFYRHTYGERVANEVWWGGMQALFTIDPYDPAHEAKPYGAAGADMASGTLKIYLQFRATHICGSPDRKWIVADDVKGNVWLIRPDTGERRLLAQGTSPSFTPDSNAVVCNSSIKEEILMVTLPEWDSLPKAQLGD